MCSNMGNGGKVGAGNTAPASDIMSHNDRLQNDYGELFKGRENTELYPDEMKKQYNLTDEDIKSLNLYQKQQTGRIISAGLGEYKYGGTYYDLAKTSESYMPKGVIEEKRKRERAIDIARLHYDGKLYNNMYYLAWKMRNKK